MSKPMSFVILSCALLVLAGCWDRVEIEDRGFVVAVGVDMAKPKKGEKRPVYTVTSQLVVPAAIGKTQQKTKGPAFINMAAKGASILEAIRDLSSRSSRTPYYEHNKLAIFSKALAKSGHLESVLDLFLRDPEGRRSTKVIISDGKASEILSVKPQNEKYPGLYINSLSSNAYKSLSVYPPVRIGDVHESMLLGHSFALPIIKKQTPTQLKLAGAAVIHGGDMKMVGRLSPKETVGLKILIDKAQGGILEIEIKGKLVVFEVRGVDTSIEANLQNKRAPEFTITLNITGRLAESHLHRDHIQQKVLSTIRAKVEKRVKQLTGLTIQKLQEQYKTDALKLARFLHNYHYEYWQWADENWDSGKNIFANAKIKVKPEVKVSEIGIVNETSR